MKTLVEFIIMVVVILILGEMLCQVLGFSLVDRYKLAVIEVINYLKYTNII